MQFTPILEPDSAHNMRAALALQHYLRNMRNLLGNDPEQLQIPPSPPTQSHSEEPPFSQTRIESSSSLHRHYMRRTRYAGTQATATPNFSARMEEAGEGRAGERIREEDEKKRNCIVDVEDEYMLNFKVVYTDGGDYSPAYSVENVLKDDNNVYCSSKSGNINILFRFSDSQPGSSSTSCVLTELVVKAPTQGFTAPCKEGMLFISHDLIPLQATLKYDNFTQRDYDDLITKSQGLASAPDELLPAAFFHLEASSNYCTRVPLKHRSAKYLLVKLLRSEKCSENVDVQYIGMRGYTGARSFPLGELI
ncbi:uncharacterized protein VTP21DRAFT_7008 [Calcarisporiella thermophila]|uniref:uncharacterized protein n=1 Tax=Calcarisporiella thermophila TaxID=911321 RepID=UPI003742017E